MGLNDLDINHIFQNYQKNTTFNSLQTNYVNR
jgi:hypothetical protein